MTDRQQPPALPKLRRWAVPVKVALSAWSDTSVTVFLLGSAQRDNVYPKSDERTGSQGRFKVGGNWRRQGRAEQRNETYLTYILAHFTRTVVIKAQGASTSYVFSSIKLYKIIHFTVCTRIMIQQKNQKTKARLKGRRGGKRASRPSVRHVSRVITVDLMKSPRQCTRFLQRGVDEREIRHGKQEQRATGKWCLGKTGGAYFAHQHTTGETNKQK